MTSFLKNLINVSDCDRMAILGETSYNKLIYIWRDGINMDKEEEIIELLKTYNQNHIVNLLGKLDEDKKQDLLEQISKIDFAQIMELYDNTKKEIEIKENKIEAINYLDKSKLSEEQKEKFDRLGEEIIRSGKYAVVTMAGGQGTRLRSWWSKRYF